MTVGLSLEAALRYELIHPMAANAEEPGNFRRGEEIGLFLAGHHKVTNGKRYYSGSWTAKIKIGVGLLRSNPLENRLDRHVRCENLSNFAPVSL